MPPKDRLLIIGKNSLIGRRYCQHAIQVGFQVTAWGSSDCDFLKKKQVLKKINSLKQGSYTIIFLAVINKLVENNYESYLKNLEIVKNLIEAAKDKKIQSIIFFSSIDVFGINPQIPITEETKIAPDTYYGLAKATSEWILLESGEIHKPVTVLRIPGVFGGKNENQSVIGRLFEKVKRSQPITTTNAGMTRRDFLFLGDLNRILDRLIKRKYHGKLNLVTGQSLRMKDILTSIEKTLNKNAKIRLKNQKNERDFDLIFDNRKLKKIIPNFSFTDLKEALLKKF